MQWLAEICVRRPVFAWVIILIVVVVGAVGYGRLRVDRFPKVEIPQVTVTTVLVGSGPEEIETEVTEKLEESIGTISGIEDMYSISSHGVSQIIVAFALEKNADVAVQEIRDRVSVTIPSLPDNVEAPVVQKIDPDDTPVIAVALKANKPLREITEIADKRIRPALETVQGVGQVKIIGGRKRQINVWIDPIRLRSVGATAADVQRAVVTQNAASPGGVVDTGPQRLSLRIYGRVQHVAEFGRIIIKQSEGHLVRLEDVARVEDGSEELESAARFNGVPAVLLSVRKQSGQNTVATVDAVVAKLEALRPSLPEGYGLEVVRDNSLATRTAVASVKEHLALGSLLAAIVVLFFLGSLRSTLIAGLAIPTSIVGTFGLMWAMDFNLDTITLLALALAVGIVIDDAIVVLENIFKFVHEKGMKPFPATIAATREIGLAVLATTLSLIAVFLPIAFMQSIAGRFLKSFGMTMAFAIALSLLVSFTLTPMLSARWLKRKEYEGEAGGDGKPPRKPFMERMVDFGYAPIERLYVRTLERIMRRRWVMVMLILATLGSCVPLARIAPKGFLPVSDEAQFQVVVRTPEGTSLRVTDLVAERIAREIRKISDVQLSLVTIGDNAQRTPNLANVYVKLSNPEDRKNSQIQLMERVRKEIVAKQPKEYRIQVQDVPMISGAGRSERVQYVLAGPDLDKLITYAQHIVDRLKKSPSTADADSSLIIGNPELGVTIDRDRAADLGVNSADVAFALQLLVGGVDVSDYAENSEHYDVHVRAERQYRAKIEGLSLLSVPSSKGLPVPLLNVVHIDKKSALSEVGHLNRERQVTIFANAREGYGDSNVTEALFAAVKELKMPSTYRLFPVGTSKETARTGQQFGLALGLSIVFMYLILAAQFESWLHPLTILMSLPLTVPFALISVIFFKLALDIYTMLGILVLFGVVKKNSILQVDHTNQLRKRGLERTQAIIIGSKDRLRPIMMTTVAFVAGMMPLVFSAGVGGGFNRATAGVVVGGQTLSLVLTLFATPVVYSLLDDLSRWVSAHVPWRKRDPIESGELEVIGEHELADMPAE